MRDKKPPTSENNPKNKPNRSSIYTFSLSLFLPTLLPHLSMIPTFARAHTPSPPKTSRDSPKHHAPDDEGAPGKLLARAGPRVGARSRGGRRVAHAVHGGGQPSLLIETGENCEKHRTNLGRGGGVGVIGEPVAETKDIRNVFISKKLRARYHEDVSAHFFYNRVFKFVFFEQCKEGFFRSTTPLLRILDKSCGLHVS